MLPEEVSEPNPGTACEATLGRPSFYFLMPTSLIMMPFQKTELSHTTTMYLVDQIAEYFRQNPGCISQQYDGPQAHQRNLTALEQSLANPHVWFEEATMHEDFVDNGQKRFQRSFFVADFNLLQKHGYADDDGVHVVIEEPGTGFPSLAEMEISVECH